MILVLSISPPKRNTMNGYHFWPWEKCSLPGTEIVFPFNATLAVEPFFSLNDEYPKLEGYF